MLIVEKPDLPSFIRGDC